jgi:thiosulfate/3-mercaptopyruvate sulfurtransferase
MSFLPLPPLVSTAWLAERLGNPGLVILDTSWYLPTAGRDALQEFRAGHIPGAMFFDLDEASDGATALPHMLPTEEAFATYAGGLGIGRDTAVVVYDGTGANGSAARVWWMLRAYGHQGVAVLDGGIGKWRSEGRPVETGEGRALRPVVFPARLYRSIVRDLDQVKDLLTTRRAQVVDLRSAGRFAGAEPEPRPGVPSGHMPGAVNLPYTELVQPDGTVLPDDELRARLARAGIDVNRPVVVTCGSGVSACNLLLALERLGSAPGALYDGSWTEWTSRGMPVVLGTR